MHDSSCRHTGALVDRLAAGKELSGREAEHLATCARCGAAAEHSAWLEDGLGRLVPSLVTEPIPSDVLRIPARWHGRWAPSWWRTVLATAAAVAVLAAAVAIGDQVGILVGRMGIGGSGASGASPSAYAEGSTSPGATRIISCGTPTGPGAGGVDYLEDLGGVPRVALQQQGTTVTALFARPQDAGYEYALCTWFTDTTPPVSAGGSGVGEEVPAQGPLRLFGAHRASAAGKVQTAYAGSVEAQVVQVRVERSEGEPVDATVMNGYFLASWSGDAYATRFIALGDDGESVASMGNNGWDFREWPRP